MDCPSLFLSFTSNSWNRLALRPALERPVPSPAAASPGGGTFWEAVSKHKLPAMLAVLFRCKSLGPQLLTAMQRTGTDNAVPWGRSLETSTRALESNSESYSVVVHTAKLPVSRNETLKHIAEASQWLYSLFSSHTSDTLPLVRTSRTC